MEFPDLFKQYYSSEIEILAVCFQLKQFKKQPKKNSGLNRTRTHDLAILVGCFFNCCKLKAHCKDLSFTQVYPQFTYMTFIYSYIFTIIGYMTNSQLTIYPFGLTVQLYSIALVSQRHGFESRSSLFFFRLLFRLLKLKTHCEDLSFTHAYPQFTCIIFIYSYS